MMQAKLTRIHIGLGIDEVGIQFELDDGAGGTATQRAFVALPVDATQSVWAAAQAALDATLSVLPVDMPPGAVTTALMKARNARQEAEQAQAMRREAEEARQEAERQKAETEAAISSAKAEHDREAAARQAALKDLDQQKRDADEAAAKAAAELAALTAQIEAKRAEVAPAETEK